MTSATISVRDLHAKLPWISEQVQRGRDFTVSCNARPIFRIVPMQGVKTKKYTMNDLNSLKFSSNKVPRNASENIDEICYGDWK